MKTIALNIETGANRAMLTDLPDPEVKLGNTKDPTKIEAKLREAKEKQLPRMALDPFYGQVICCSLAVRKPEGVKCATAFSAIHGEQTVIEWVWKKLTESPCRLVTFNGSGFDLPYLVARSIINDIPFPHFETSKYRVADPASAHCDVMYALHALHDSNALNLPRKLSLYARLLLGEEFPYAEVDQSQFANLQDQLAVTDGRITAGNELHDTIKGLCEWNTTTTLLLHERMFRLGHIGQPKSERCSPAAPDDTNTGELSHARRKTA